MKAIFVAALLLLISGCMISASNHHIKLEEHSAARYDDFNNIWCYTAAQLETIEICSGPYRSTSKYIGLGVPIIPQWNRSSPLAYDNKRAKLIEFRHQDSSVVELTKLAGIMRCTNKTAVKCEAVESITLDGNRSVWLKLPEGETHDFIIKSGVEKFKVTLKAFNEFRWHQVTV